MPCHTVWYVPPSACSQDCGRGIMFPGYLVSPVSTALHALYADVHDSAQHVQHRLPVRKTCAHACICISPECPCEWESHPCAFTFASCMALHLGYHCHYRTHVSM